MDTSLANITLPQFCGFFPDGEIAHFGEDFYIIQANFPGERSTGFRPCRFDCYMVIFCISCNMRLNVNLNSVELKENMMLVNLPGNIIKVEQYGGEDGADLSYIVVAMTKDFIANLSLDVSKIFNDGMTLVHNPVMKVNSDYAEHFHQHLNLISNVISSDINPKKELVNTLASAVFYLISGLWAEAAKNKDEGESMPTSRNRMIFENFMKLVAEHYTKYRNVGFYAEKLCLTPKYLSKLVKMTSGSSAPDWIDAYVILEAKNLLKNSNISIKEIVYMLNFPNQSVFYKFFKAHTGMTPSEYRNS
jgi:AraC-like DNA-binding protein